MSKERARRRAERERESGVQTAARAESAERRERRAARRRTPAARVPWTRSRPTGILVRRRRSQVRTTVVVLAVLNVLVWVFFDDWATRVGALVVSLLAAPVLHTLLFRR